MRVLSLAQASDIVDAALSKARELTLRPLTVTVACAVAGVESVSLIADAG
jgi:uncharacterized protein GlcG (DUF336 family)